MPPIKGGNKMSKIFKSEYLNIRISKDLKEKLEIISEKNAMSISDYIRFLIITAINNDKSP